MRLHFRFSTGLLACFLAVIATACSQQEPAAGGSPPPADSRHPAARVVKVVDGDTIHVILLAGNEDLGLAPGTREKVRFIGVDTPEISGRAEYYGREAAAFTRRRLDGRTVYLELDAGLRDRYGRLLAYIWLEPPTEGQADPDGKMFNTVLVKEGYAQVMTVPPNVKYVDLLVSLQREAREAGRGLWGAR